MSKSDLPLREAYSLISSGNKLQAVQILVPLIFRDDNNANVWWLLANSMASSARARPVLQKVLRIQPGHKGAIAALDRSNQSTQNQIDIEQDLGQARAFIKASKHAEAAQMLIPVICMNTKLADAWQLLLQTIEDPIQQRQLAKRIMPTRMSQIVIDKPQINIPRTTSRMRSPISVPKSLIIALGGILGLALFIVGFVIAKDPLISFYNSIISVADANSPFSFLAGISWQTCFLFPTIYFSVLTVPALLISLGPGLGMLLVDRSGYRFKSDAVSPLALVRWVQFIAVIFGVLSVLAIILVTSAFFVQSISLSSLIGIETVFVLLATMILTSRILFLLDKPGILIKSVVSLCLLFWVLLFILIYISLRSVTHRVGLMSVLKIASILLGGRWSKAFFADLFQRMGESSSTKEEPLSREEKLQREEAQYQRDLARQENARRHRPIIGKDAHYED